MKIFKSLIILLFVVIGAFGEERILLNYGVDKCQFCGMTVKSEKFGSIGITNENKKITFCSIECAVAYYILNKDKIKEIKVPNFLNPSEFINASDAYFLKSDKIKTMMGMNLSAYKSIDEATKMKNEKGGEIYNWKEVQELINKEFLPRFESKHHH
jgi:copper chaperone NosL